FRLGHSVSLRKLAAAYQYAKKGQALTGDSSIEDGEVDLDHGVDILIGGRGPYLIGIRRRAGRPEDKDQVLLLSNRRHFPQRYVEVKDSLAGVHRLDGPGVRRMTCLADERMYLQGSKALALGPELQRQRLIAGPPQHLHNLTCPFIATE